MRDILECMAALEERNEYFGKLSQELCSQRNALLADLNNTRKRLGLPPRPEMPNCFETY